jgi:hypothetical protein
VTTDYPWNQIHNGQILQALPPFISVEVCIYLIKFSSLNGHHQIQRNSGFVIPSLLLISIKFLFFANTNYIILLLLYLFTFSLVFPEFLFVYLRMPNFGFKFSNLAGMPGGSINLHLATTLMHAREIKQQIKLQKCHVSWTLGNSGKLAAGKIVCGVFIKRRNLLQICKIWLISDKHLSF